MKKLAALLLIIIMAKAFHVSQVHALSVNTSNISDTLPPANPLMRPNTMYKDSAYSKDSSQKSFSDSAGTTPNYNENILKQKDSTNRL